MDNTIPKSVQPLTKKDFESDQMVKWCPGCGDHAILKSVEKVFPELGYKKENYVVVSGIGCSSRFPYYMNTYGIHGIHGRAAPIATGVKLANPDLSVWVITGDGDSMAIGGNHFIHTVRRNVDLNILLFNNQIYGLTKGQYSPTTPLGKITKTSPQGTIEHPFNPGELVIGSRGTFFARAVDMNPKLLTSILFEAARHDGTSVVEILQNCVIYNDKTHQLITSKETKHDNQLVVEHGKPMIFGKNNEKGLYLNSQNKIEIVKIGENGINEEDLMVHDMHDPDPTVHLKLANLAPPEFPAVLGVIRSSKSATYDDMLEEQIETAREESDIKTMDDLLNSGDTWEM
ncbi:MAG: 2-oxoacid:ferredoxin oxidoreductase subunit beta [Bacteroidales bacterium]|nr:2-oxoacid:ferredoxin oxidoreductase subunit beta [Bacteroidales bacterium]MCF8333525.1 2-oxoacid:ferredoxin oxidoreductase subunit beta [Bacteroidales bacterium]